ncbi:MAG: response regulator [Calditrichaeota bacterium]|nr:response regulator [Calditrichota bacterium]
MPINKVLLIEDESDIALIIQNILDMQQIETIVAPDGTTALELLKQHQVQGVIMDLNLPDMGGMELHDRIIATFPELEGKFLFMSGYDIDNELEAVLQRTRNLFIHKPFHLDKFRQAVESLLSR